MKENLVLLVSMSVPDHHSISSMKNNALSKHFVCHWSIRSTYNGCLSSLLYVIQPSPHPGQGPKQALYLVSAFLRSAFVDNTNYICKIGYYSQLKKPCLAFSAEPHTHTHFGRSPLVIFILFEAHNTDR